MSTIQLDTFILIVIFISQWQLTITLLTAIHPMHP